jgi:1-acyl-sn-glycerol-3-phosphate acyltransferase
LDRSWRLVATAVLFTVFGVGGVVAGVTVFPIIALLSREDEARTRRARGLVRRSFRSFLWLMKASRVARFDIEPGAAAKLAAERGTIIVANHPTLLDVVMLLALAEQANCVVKAALWRNPFLRWGVRAAGYIPNDDLEALMDSCDRVLREGQTLIIFPEATRTIPSKPIELQRGAASIALRADASLRVVHLKCEPPTLSKSENWYQIPAHQPCFSMRVGVTLHPRDYLRTGKHLAVATRRLTKALRAELSKDPFVNERPGNGAQAASDRRAKSRGSDC